MQINKKELLGLLLLFGVCLLLFFYKLGSYNLIDVDEPRYAEAAKEMLKSSDWITPHFNYNVRFDKPVFFYWLIAISYLTFGITEFAARFPSALLATLMVFFTYYFGRRTISHKFGLISGLILVSSLEFFLLGRMCITDMTLTFFICATIYAGFLGSFAEERKKKCWWWLAYFFSGIAVLTKGPVGFVLPAMIFGIYFILTGTLKENLKPKYLVPGVLIFLITVIPWYYLVIKANGYAFVEYFFIKHNLGRFATKELGHTQPFYFYAIVLLIGLFPWSFFFIPAFIKNVCLVFREAKFDFKNTGLAFYKNINVKSGVILYCIIWFIVVFLFYSISKAKMVSYIMPLFPVSSLLIAGLWQKSFESEKNSKSITIPTIFNIILLVLAGITAVIILNTGKLNSININFGNIIYPTALLFIFISVFILFYTYKKHKQKVFAGFITLMLGLALIAVNNIKPILLNVSQKDLIKGREIVQNAKLQGKELYTYALTKPSLIFYYDKKIPNIEGEDFPRIENSLKKQTPVFIIMRNERIDQISGRFKFFIINKGDRISLISNTKIQAK